MDRRTYERRKKLPGFPKEGKFRTKAEVDAYLSGEKIQCLLCGKWFHKMGAHHLIAIHGITADDYRERYGIPWGRGLIGMLNREKSIRLAKSMIEEGILNTGVKDAPQPNITNRNSRPSPDCVLNPKGWRRKDFEAILKRIREQERSLNQVCGDQDLPNNSDWNRYAKKHPEFEAKLQEVRHGLPYAHQARIKKLSPRFRIDCERMRLEGMTQKRIAKTLNVCPGVVGRVLRGFDDKMGLTFAKNRKFVREDFEALLARIREQKRTLTDVCKDPDLPSMSLWLKYIKKHPEFEAERLKIYHSLPYFFQSRARHFSPDFRKDCERLRAKGMTGKSIAKTLGVSEGPVERELRDFNEKMGLTRAKPRKWVREDFEAILARIREQQRPLTDVCQDPDLPDKTRWSVYTNKHPELNAKLREVYHNMPYPFQSRVKFFSPRFRIDCERLRARGMMIESIAEALGAPLKSVKRVLQDFNERTGLTKKQHKWAREDFEAILDRIGEQQRYLADVCGDPDLPGIGVWKTYAKKHPEITTKLREVYHSLHYSFQSRARSFSPGFRIDCERLRAGGMTTNYIAKKLGVSHHTVARVLRDFDEKTGIARLNVSRWRRKDYEAILNRIREQRRSLRDVCGDPDLPGANAWNRYTRNHPEFRVKLQEVYHRLPYSFQAGVSGYSPRFRIDCERLRAEGMTIKSIAETLGVYRSGVTRVLRGFNQRRLDENSKKK